MAKKAKRFRGVAGGCRLLLKICRLPKESRTSLTGKIAFFLLLTNVPVGLGGAALCGLLYGLSGKNIYLWAAPAVYAFSWLMLILGIFWAGKEMAAKISATSRRKIAVWKRWRKLGQNCATSE